MVWLTRVGANEGMDALLVDAVVVELTPGPRWVLATAGRCQGNARGNTLVLGVEL